MKFDEPWEKKTARFEVKVEPSLKDETTRLAGGPYRTSEYIRQAVREKNEREEKARAAETRRQTIAAQRSAARGRKGGRR